MALNAANFPDKLQALFFQMSLSPVPNGTTVYLDNFAFYKSTVVSSTEPTCCCTNTYSFRI
jgi:hypothetical protein